jgi:hypothetical protein
VWLHANPELSGLSGDGSRRAMPKNQVNIYSKPL